MVRKRTSLRHLSRLVPMRPTTAKEKARVAAGAAAAVVMTAVLFAFAMGFLLAR
ncbi:hypothetical protein ABIC03_002662 [Bradyrhizobium sp. RT6a]